MILKLKQTFSYILGKSIVLYVFNENVLSHKQYKLKFPPHRWANKKKNIRGAEFRDLEQDSALANLLVHWREGREADGAVIKNNDQQLSALFDTHIHTPDLALAVP